jgi:putative flippase GtrA
MTASTFADTLAPGPLEASSHPPAKARDAAEGRRTSAEFARYFACSALALAVDTGLYAMLLSLGLGWSVAAAAGFGSGLLVAYGLSVRFVFAHRCLRDARAEFALFAAIGVVGLLLTEALLWLLVEGLGIGPLPAKLLTAGAVFTSNFTLRKALLFTRRPRSG